MRATTHTGGTIKFVHTDKSMEEAMEDTESTADFKQALNDWRAGKKIRKDYDGSYEDEDEDDEKLPTWFIVLSLIVLGGIGIGIYFAVKYIRGIW